MLTPDIRTLFLILFLVNVFFTLILFIFWKTQKTYYGFRTWMLSLLVISCGYFLFLLRGSVSDFLSIIIANILIALSVMMRVDSIRKYFWSKPLSPVFYSILIPFAGLFLYYTYSIDSVLLRSLISNVIIVPCLLITGLLAIRSQEPDNRLLRFSFAATFIVVGILLTVRSISWLITPQNQSLFSTDLLNAYYFVVTIITDIIGIGIFLMLNMARSQMELRASEKTLRLANKKLKLLSGITRHDITNQLTVLVGYLRILERKQPDTSCSEHFKKINTSAQRIAAMIQFTREYEKIGINIPSWQDCRTLVDAAVKQAPLGKVMVKNDLPPGTEVFADPLVIRVFFNLIDNAVRYGNKITTIRFSVEECDGDHLIVCEDDGDGVVAGEKEKIFERGYGKNTGMGLFLAREILDITGITIRETGEAGKGARFEMTVPKGAYRMRGVGA